MNKFLAVPLILTLFHTACATDGISRWHIERFPFIERPVIGALPTGEPIRLGGLSDLKFLKSVNGEHYFVSITDRGPNVNLLNKRGPDDTRRPFLIANYNPTIIFLKTDRASQTLQLVKRVELRGPDKKILTGLPPAQPDAHGAYEIAIDTAGRELPRQLLGIDSESLTIDGDGNFWVGEEYRPALLRFNKDGVLERLYVPAGYFSPEALNQLRGHYGRSDFVRQILPRDLLFRRVNRGFEGIAFYKGKIIAALQSPLRKPEEDQQTIRWLQIDPATEQLRELFYPIADGEKLFISALGASSDGEGLYVIEQDSNVGPGSTHSIYRAIPRGSRIQKNLVIDMVKLGVHEFEKVEGLAPLPGGAFAIVNDDDFGLTNDTQVGVDPSRPNELIIFSPAN